MGRQKWEEFSYESDSSIPVKLELTRMSHNTISVTLNSYIRIKNLNGLSFRLGQVMEGGSLRIVDKEGKELPVSTF